MPINVNGVGIPGPPHFQYTDRYLGDPSSVPWDITRRRRSIENYFRRFGQPVLIKHRYTDLDVRRGIAVKAVDRDDAFGQARYASFSLSTGYVSAELSPDEWYTLASGNLMLSAFNPGPGYIQAPKYRGFGPSYETYIIDLDKARDFFSFQPGGALMNVEQGAVFAPWFPKIFDGDLIVEVVRDKGGNVLSTSQVWEAKMVTPLTMRGRDRFGRTELNTDPNYINTPNRFIMSQRLETSLVPVLDIRTTQLQVDR